MAKIKLTIEELEVILAQYKGKIIENIKSTIGSGQAIQDFRSSQRQQKVEALDHLEPDLLTDIESIVQRTSLPHEIEILKKYLSDGKK